MRIKTITITKSLIVSIAVIVIIILLPIFVRQSRSELEKTIMTCETSYSDVWKLSSVTQDDSNRKIVIHFRYSSGDLQTQMETMQKSYESISDVLLKQSASKYKDYIISYSFEYTQKKLMLMNVDQNFNQIQLHSDMQISLLSLASFFPQASELYLYPAYFQEIDEIKNFRALRKIYFSQGVTAEDIETIHRLYPDCVIAN